MAEPESARYVAAPRLPDSFDRLKAPLPAPFDPGANWCGYCRNLAGTMALPSMRAFVQRHFVELPVDVGRFDRNLEIAGRYDVDPLPGVPVVLIVDPASDRVLNEGQVSLFVHLKRPGPQEIANWLAQWVRPASGG